MTAQPDPANDHEASPTAPSDGLACAFGTPWMAHFDGTGCAACDAETERGCQEFQAAVAAGELLRSGHTPEEWRRSLPLFPYDPNEDGIQWDNGEAPDEEDE